MATQNENKLKPKYDKLDRVVQVPLKEHVFKQLDRIRRESTYPTNAAYVRALIMENLKGKKQTELF